MEFEIKLASQLVTNYTAHVSNEERRQSINLNKQEKAAKGVLITPDSQHNYSTEGASILLDENGEWASDEFRLIDNSI
jgi:hypothetical protein